MEYAPARFHKSARRLAETGEPFTFTPENQATFDEIVTHYPPERRKSAILYALYLAQRQQGYLTAAAMRHVADQLGCTAAEVEDVVRHLKSQGHPEYVEAVTQEPDDEDGEDPYGVMEGEGGGNDLFDKAVAIVARERKVSTSYIQRRLQIGYNRAARIIEQMEEQGVVSKADRVGRREVLVGDH